MDQNQLQDPLGALRFIVEFAQTDLATAQARQLRALDRGVQAFINRETPGHWIAEDEPDRLRLGVYQQRALEMLSDIARQRPLTMSGDLVLTFWAFRDGKTLRVEVGGSPLDLLLYQIIRVLEAVGAGNLLACPECGRVFVKVTKKVFCSTRCQSRVYMRGYRERGYEPKATRTRRRQHQ